MEKLKAYKGNIVDNLSLRQDYELLGVKPSATKEEIRKAYHYKMRNAHPDLNRDCDPETVKKITVAYSNISNSYKENVRSKQFPAKPTQQTPSTNAGYSKIDEKFVKVFLSNKLGELKDSEIAQFVYLMIATDTNSNLDKIAKSDHQLVGAIIFALNKNIKWFLSSNIEKKAIWSRQLYQTAKELHASLPSCLKNIYEIDKDIHAKIALEFMYQK